MSKRSFFPFFFLWFWANFIAAQKHDYMWPLGLGPDWSDFNFFLDFEGGDTPSVIIRTDTMSTGSYAASYCSADGQIVFYSNGLRILNKEGNFVENSQNLNPTITLPEWNNKSYPGHQSGFFLEKPGDPNLVYFISLDFGLHPAQKWPYIYVGQNLMVATIDVLANNGMGKVTEKNQILLTGTLMAPAACRHANGRDWWILVSNADENIHYRIFLGPEGFSAPDTQYIGTKPNPIPYLGGNSSNQIAGNCFSPQGNYYADINDNRGFSIFHFNRCSGLLSNERRVDYPPPIHPFFYQNDSGSGAVFSQNDSLFYKTTRYTVSSFPAAPAGTKPFLLQFDLASVDLASTPDTINIVDSSVYHLPANITWEGFYGAELGPDGRIYVVHSGLGYCTVQYPNVKGRDCKFVHDKPFFDIVIGSAIPYMPNYRLGPLDGSPCDTLGLNNIPVANFRIDDSLSLFTRYFYDLSHHEPASWLWDFGDGAISTEHSPLHTYAGTGIYQVCLTVSNQFGANTYCKTLYLGVSKTDSPDMENQVQISPNPFRDHLLITLSADQLKPVFRLYDLMGRLVREIDLSTGTTVLESTFLQPGLYFWEVESMGKLVNSGKVFKPAD